MIFFYMLIYFIIAFVTYPISLSFHINKCKRLERKFNVQDHNDVLGPAVIWPLFYAMFLTDKLMRWEDNRTQRKIDNINKKHFNEYDYIKDPEDRLPQIYEKAIFDSRENS